MDRRISLSSAVDWNDLNESQPGGSGSPKRGGNSSPHSNLPVIPVASKEVLNELVGKQDSCKTETYSSYVHEKIHQQWRINDEDGAFTVLLIIMAVGVALCCGLAAFILHLVVGYSGCVAHLNGCHEQVVVDVMKQVGISTPLYFIISCTLSGLACSLILDSPWSPEGARQCKGGGGGHTKIMVASGTPANVSIGFYRILLTSVYMGGGNPLGTEGPIIHLSVALATWLVSKMGHKRRKVFSTFAVIGAAAGISAGFNVLVTGFVYVTEELTRSLSRKLALILALAAAVAVLLKMYVAELLEIWIHPPHASLVPDPASWDELTHKDIQFGLLLSLPIGALMGVAGWIFTDRAWKLLKLLKPGAAGDEDTKGLHYWLHRLVPEWLHLAIVGFLCGCFGAIGYKVTGMNGVWGTTISVIPDSIEKLLTWDQLVLLFVLKFCVFILATAARGPGGLLVPSLVTGGLLGLGVGRAVGASNALCSACAVMGMGSMFASVMHMPLTGVIIMFELTQATELMLHVVIANFVASNVIARLPHGKHSFVHRCLEEDATWHKLHEQDFIETDDQEREANAAMTVFDIFFMISDQDRMRFAFDGWVDGVTIGRLEVENGAVNGMGDATSTNLVVTPKNDKPTPLILPMPNAIMPLSLPVTIRSRSKDDLDASGRSTPKNSLKSPSIAKVFPERTTARANSRSRSENGDATGASNRAEILGNTEARPKLVRSHTTGELGELSKKKAGENDAQRSQPVTDDEESKLRRKAARNQWELVSRIIPGLNVRIWKSLDARSKAAICSAVEMMEKCGATSAGLPNGNDDLEWAATDLILMRTCSDPGYLRTPSGDPPSIKQVVELPARIPSQTSELRDLQVIEISDEHATKSGRAEKPKMSWT